MDMTQRLENHPSVLLNKLGKANKMIVEYALESPGDYGRTAPEIADSLARWSAHRDRLVVTYDMLYGRQDR